MSKIGISRSTAGEIQDLEHYNYDEKSTEIL